MTYRLPPNYRYRPEKSGNVWLIRDVTRTVNERAHLLLEDLATTEKQALRDCRIANNAFDEGVQAAMALVSRDIAAAALRLNTHKGILQPV
jgi:hypothetical protein